MSLLEAKTNSSTIATTSNTDSDSNLNADLETRNNMDAPSTVRKRTRATAEQLSVLEDTFAANVSPNSKLRKELSERLQMSERSIQIWFQNRRAKVKHMQKRAQMQMQQASIRAQLYHYHQQQYGMQPYGGTPIMPLPQQQQQQAVYSRGEPMQRSSSMDTNSVHQLSTPSMSTPPASTSSSCTSSSSPNASLDSLIPPPTHHLSYPLQDTGDFPDYLHGGPLSPSPSPHHDYPSAYLSSTVSPLDLSVVSTATSSMPSLVAVPDAGPTAMLATSSSLSSSSSSSSSSTASALMTPGHITSTPATTPPLGLVDQATVSPQDIWPSSIHHGQHAMRSQSVSAGSSLNTSSKEPDLTHPLERSLSNPPMTTIDPSNLMMSSTNMGMDPAATATSPLASTTTTTSNDVFLNCTTLTIGTWHRLKLRSSDLLCTFKTNGFEWQIEDAGCHFKMEIPLSSIANIDFSQDATNSVLADVHFDISESPLFYMETASHTGSTWVQCSDFTEGKQASRFFRHSLKGVSHHLKQDLMMLMDRYPETRRWIRFIDPYPQQPHHPYVAPPPPPPHYSAPVMDPYSSMYIPPSTPYWSSSMYPAAQTPIIMGGSTHFV